MSLVPQLDKTQSQNKNTQLLVVHLIAKYNAHNLFSSDFLYSLHYLWLCINPWFIVGEIHNHPAHAVLTHQSNFHHCC